MQLVQDAGQQVLLYRAARKPFCQPVRWKVEHIPFCTRRALLYTSSPIRSRACNNVAIELKVQFATKVIRLCQR